MGHHYFLFISSLEERALEAWELELVTVEETMEKYVLDGYQRKQTKQSDLFECGNPLRGDGGSLIAWDL